MRAAREQDRPRGEAEIDRPQGGFHHGYH
jgi:hypothetical protein